MKAGIYLGKEQIELRELPLPEVGDNDVLVQNLYSGICGTDVAVFFHGPNTGHKVTVGGEFGHETVSRVVKVGKNVTDFTVGERVYPYPRCAKDDTKRAGTIGGFSEYILIPNAKRDHSLYAVDERISDKLASLIEPFTVGCRAARRGMIPCGQGQYVTGQNTLVFGCGTIGIAAAVALKHFGMEKVMLCNRSDFRLKLAVIRRKTGRPAKAKKKICRNLRRSSVRTMNKAAPEWEPPCWQRVQFSFRTQRSRERRMLPSSSSPRSAIKGARSSVMPSRSHWLVSPSRAAA